MLHIFKHHNRIQNNDLGFDTMHQIVEIYDVTKARIQAMCNQYVDAQEE